MKFLISILIFSSLSLQAQTLATYTYLKSKPASTKTVSFEDFKQAYKGVKSFSFNAPKPDQFLNDYLRFKVAVEVALKDKSIVSSDKIINLIKDPFLKRSFEQEIYKAFAESKLQSQMKVIDKRAASLSKKKRQNLYRKAPEFNFHYISVNWPVNPSAKQKQEAKSRAQKIYSQVVKSKKSFPELVSLMSDEKILGALSVNRGKNVVLPNVYKQLLRMKNGQVSKPILTATGYKVVKLKRKVPFSEANQTTIKANYFNEERTRAFNRYFENLKKDFKISVPGRKLLKQLR